MKVLAMLQMDMTAWVKAGTEESVGIIQDFVDPDLTEFLYDLVEKYCKCLATLRMIANEGSVNPPGQDAVRILLLRPLELQQSRVPVSLRVSQDRTYWTAI